MISQNPYNFLWLWFTYKELSYQEKCTKNIYMILSCVKIQMAFEIGLIYHILRKVICYIVFHIN